MERPELKLGRTAFGGDPQAYDAARQDYPARLFELIRQRCAVGQMTRAFEIGPGTGKATRAMLGLGLGSLTGVEPDTRLAAYLRLALPDPRLRLEEATFEAAGSIELVSPARGEGLVVTVRHGSSGGACRLPWQSVADANAVRVTTTPAALDLSARPSHARSRPNARSTRGSPVPSALASSAE